MTEQTHVLTMPAFGADMATGTLIEWQVKAGDRVQRGDVIAVIETNKGAIELDIFEDTVIEALLVEVGDEIQVGTGIAKLRGAASQEEEKTEAEISAEPVPLPQTEDTTGTFVPATPAARKRAVKNQLDLAAFASKLSHPVTLKDLPDEQKSGGITNKNKESNETKASKPEPDDVKQMMRQAISDTVTLSKQTIPHYYLNHRLDVTRLWQYLAEYNKDKEPEERLLLAAFMLTAIARLLIKHPQLNGQFIDNQFNKQTSVNLAHAVNIRGTGLIMPVIREAEKLNPATIMQTLTKQVTEARRGRLPLSQLTGASCTVSSIGERGAEQMSAIILPPQVAIISLGCIHQEPLVIEGEVQIRDVIMSGLAADHRVSDGHVGAKFLYQLNQLIQKPEQLWTESK